MDIYNAVRQVPKDAQTRIEGGPLKGKTNINPMFRIQKLVELAGVCGRDWYIKEKDRWTQKTESGDVAVFVEVELYIRFGSEWSQPIFGTGGNTLIRTSVEWVNGQQVAVQRIDDEAYKKAYTDAVSVACKALGFAADVYYTQEETKYGSFHAAPAALPQPQPDDQPQAQWPWTKGFKEIAPDTDNWKASVTQVSKMADVPADEILGRITAKFNITQENFSRLLAVANRAS